jgi:DNA-3-methyladenine glycosylase I
MRERCPWARTERSIAYHDSEWGVPVHDDRLLFEFLILEGAQAGLSWETILLKRERYREVFDGFDAARVARYDRRKVASLLADPGIVRNRLKVEGAVKNARAFLEVQAEFGGPPARGRKAGGFDRFIWSFVDGKPIVNRPTMMREIPTRTAISDSMSKDLKRRGFTFVGSTICYAFMQAVGMVDDHVQCCFRSRANPKRRAR